MDEKRNQRISEALRDELAELVVYGLADPRIELQGITAVHLSRDGRRADVLIHGGGDAGQLERTLNALAEARGYLRKQLSLRLTLRQVPDLRFLPDSGTASADRMDVLWKKAQKWRRKLEKESKSSSETDGGGTP
jgi:ribosome-binding factor A